MNTKTDENHWAIVLAAGEGTRLAALTEAVYGFALPKQFSALCGGSSMLQATVERLAPLVPPARTVVVVAATYAELAAAQLARFPGITIIAQPANRGTGPGILLPLAEVCQRAPSADVIVAPSDHYIPAPAPFIDAVRYALARTRSAPITLLGIRAESPETEYGWILPGEPLDEEIRGVDRFVEKPTLAEACRLEAAGALWNSFVMVAGAQRLWELAHEHLPEHARAIETCLREERGSTRHLLARAYASMPDASFSTSVLERARGLGVLAVEGTGWTDWGTPMRVLRSLRGRAELPPLLARLAQPLQSFEIG